MSWVVVVEIHGEPARALGPFRIYDRARAALEMIEIKLQEEGPDSMGVAPHVEQCYPGGNWEAVLEGLL